MRGKRQVIFVGAFARSAGDGTIGGQIYACWSLVQSPLSEKVDWLFVDSTMLRQPPPRIWVRFWLAVRRILRLLWLLLTQRADSVLIFTAYEPLSFLEKGLMALLARLWGKSVVLSLRSEIRPDRFDPWLLGYRRAVLRRCHRLIVQSPQAKERLLALGVDAGQVAVVSNWLNVGDYAGERPPRHGPRHFVYLGWLEELKGLRELLAAARILQAAGEPFTLTICGGGSMAAELRESVRQSGLTGAVQILGWIYGEDKVRCLLSADVLVLPSHTEGLPNALLEAMACGLAAIVTPVGGVPSVVQDGVGGLVVPVGDGAALAAAMRRLVADPALVSAMGERNRAYVRAHHDVETAWPAVGRILGLEESD